MNMQREHSATPSQPRRIILCADDYAQSPAISSGILQLVERRRLSAVSCFTEGEFWSSPGNTLFDYREQIDIGVHFNLTQPFAGSTATAQPLNRVMSLAMSGRIDREQVTTALRAQLDRFENVAKQIPDFVDGHQHVHVLPVIRQIVVDELARRYGGKKPYLRTVNPRLSIHGGIVKLFVLKLLGSGFQKLAERRNIKTNRGFSGIYSLEPNADFAALMGRWFDAADNGDLVMCHPGARGIDNLDPIAATRPSELAFLLGDDFAALLSRNAIRLSRFREIEH